MLAVRGLIGYRRMAVDNLFVDTNIERFEFNGDVANVFDDMLKRSVPLYDALLNQIAQLCTSYSTADHPTIYDLGCSTGALVPRLNKRNASFKYVGIDLSKPMIDRAQRHASENVSFVQSDILDVVQFESVGVIVCNLVLQFVPLDQREALLKQYYDALPKGGALIVVEKIRQADDVMQTMYNDAFYQYKRTNGYSDAEIFNKEASLKGVLMPATNDYYLNQFQSLSFSLSDIFYKWYNFVGYLAIK